MRSKFETHVEPFLDKIGAWAEKGATAKDIAKKLNIAYSTFKKYLDLGRKGDERYAAFAALFAQACEVPDDEVEDALFRLCIGYNAPVKKAIKVKRVEYEDGKRVLEKEEVVLVEEEVHVQANVTAQMFWLANRRRDRWAYKPTEGSTEENEDLGVVLLPEVGSGG